MKVLYTLLIASMLYANSLSFKDKVYLIRSVNGEHQILFRKHAAIYKVEDSKFLKDLKQALKSNLQVSVTTNSQSMLITKVEIIR